MTAMGRPTYVETRWVPIGALRDFPGNPRVHDDETLDAIVGDLGQATALTVRRHGRASWEILGGHGTRDALARAGHDEVLIQVWDCDDRTARKVVAGLNKASDSAGYQAQLQAELLRRLDAEGGLAGAGWTCWTPGSSG